jgi:catechol 2,3-dioxygenase-like lactoylglutathione lyase family enzyme
MGLGGLQHYTIEPSDLERTKDFYCDVLGLENGERPPLGFPGYWLYSGGTATVHLMGTRTPREGIVVRGTEKKYEDTGRLDHIAFAATDVDGMRNACSQRTSSSARASCRGPAIRSSSSTIPTVSAWN